MDNFLSLVVAAVLAQDSGSGNARAVAACLPHLKALAVSLWAVVEP